MESKSKRLKIELNDGNELPNAERIATLCYETYRMLGKSGKPVDPKNEFTVLAAMVETIATTETGDDPPPPRVVCLATGTKCFPGNVPYRREDIVDCHAESLLKRAFKRYLLGLADRWLMENPAPTSLNQFHDDVIKHRTFTMFVSQAPCGSFSRWKGDDDADGQCSAGQFRREYKSIGVNRKPGRGELCPKPGCIHKLAKWRVFGMQGARILTFTRKPVTFDRLVIGNCEQPPITDMDIIKNRLKIDPKEIGGDNFEPGATEVFSFFQPIRLELAEEFGREEFLRFKNHNGDGEKNPCGSSIVAWRSHQDPRHPLKTEILAGGRRLGSGKRKKSVADTRPGSGVATISDHLLNQDVDAIVDRFQSRFSSENSLVVDNEFYHRAWEAAKRSVSIYQGWPIISESKDQVSGGV